ncbi:MAG: hypothetical protein EA363_09915 [Balneolaceae bacterium]|nr:MAG: hypothetical protein EA363_09915 [Balneolaceae bacterium]
MIYDHIIGGVATLLLLAGCTAKMHDAVPWSYGEDVFVFIEFIQIKEGSVIQGNYPPGPMIDAPTYFFDKEQKSLASQRIPFEIDDTLKVVYGRYSALRGAAGGGASSRLFGVYRFPYEDGELMIMGVDPTGNTHLKYRDDKLVIESHDQYIHTVTHRDTVATPQGPAIADFTTTIRIINHGVMDKGMIRSW